MSVRQSLLAILDQGACYGYQLRAEFGRRTGWTWPLNVGQIYNTLERLRRDGLVAEGDTDEHGHVYWQITDSGRAAVREWLDAPVVHSSVARDEVAAKISFAATLPGVDVERMLRSQRVASEAHLVALRAERSGADDFARLLMLDAMVLAAEAQVRWIDRAGDRLAGHPARSAALELSAEKPRRGRPARVEAPVASDPDATRHPPLANTARPTPVRP